MTAPDPLLLLADRIAPLPNPWRDKPVEWTTTKLNEVLTDDQVKIMHSVVEHRYTAVKSCNGVGKSRTASRLAAHWIDSHPLGEAFVVTTAPTRSQVHNVLWRYIGQLHRDAELPGYVTGDDEWKLEHPGSSPEPIAYGRKPADNNPGAFSGIHAPYVLVILDEACGIPASLYHVASSLATNRNARVLAIGNPDDPSSHFKKMCDPGSGWNVITIDALRSDNMTAQALKPYPEVRKLMVEAGIPPSTKPVPQVIRDGLVDPGWVAEQMRQMGVNSPMFTSKVRGEFPKITNDMLISPHFVTLAQSRDTDPSPYLARLGVDVARYGVDHTIVVSRQGAHARIVYDIPYGPVTETAGVVMQYAAEKFFSKGIEQPPACVDDAGVGGGVVDILLENNYPVVPIVHSQGSTQKLANGKSRFYNKRSELLWNLREAFVGKSGTGEDGWIDIDPEDHVLAAQLTNIRYRINQHGQIVIESKDEMKARGLPSPDRADALSYSMAPDEPSRHTADMSHMITGDLATLGW